MNSLGVPIKETALFAQHYAGSNINKYFIWKEDSSSNDHLTERQKVIDEITRMLPKYFFRAHKQKIRRLTEHIMFDKISLSQFWLIYQEITGDETVPENAKQTEYDERVRLILKNADPTLCRDLQVNNARKEKFGPFWDIAKEQISEFNSS